MQPRRALLLACLLAAAAPGACRLQSGTAARLARLARLERHVSFLHERVAEYICGPSSGKATGDEVITASGAWCLVKEGEVLGYPVAPGHFLDTSLAEYIYDSVLSSAASVLDLGAGSGQARTRSASPCVWHCCDRSAACGISC
jgi:hypothetical protein